MTPSRLLSLVGASALALLLAVAPGCVKGKMKAVLGKDGSGTITQSQTVDLSKFEGLAEMFKGLNPGGEEGGDDPIKQIDEESDPEAIKKKLAGKKGVELLSATRTDDADKKTRTAEHKVKFTTLEDYFRSGIAKGVDVKLEQLEGGAWKLTEVMGDTGGDDPEAAAMQEQMMEGFKPMLEPFMGDLEMSFSIELPGTIVETNGTKNEAGTGVTWKLGFAELFDAKKRSFTVTFKGDGLTLKPFHVVTDQQGEVKDPKAKPAAKPDAPKDEAPKEPAPKEPEAPKEPAGEPK